MRETLASLFPEEYWKIKKEQKKDAEAFLKEVISELERLLPKW